MRSFLHRSVAVVEKILFYPFLMDEGVSVMTEKELKKLTRYQLLELLIVQTERADKLQQQLDKAQQRLNDKEIQMTVLGSIAEASLELSGVFAAAQKAADMYLEAAKKKADQILREAEEQAGRLPEESEESEEPEAPKAPEQPEYQDEDPARVDKIWSMLEGL